MASRHDQNTGGSSVVRLFGWTALIAVVFSVGVIVGQRLLVEYDLPPAVQAGDQVPALASTAESSTESMSDSDNSPDLFSFYEALTNGDTDQKPPASPPEDDVDESDASSDAENDQEKPARYTLQIASHSTMDEARAVMDRLEAKQLEPTVVSDRGPDDTTIYHVRVGRFPGESQARAFANRLEGEHDLQTLVSPL